MYELVLMDEVKFGVGKRCREEDPTLETQFKPGGKSDNDKDRVVSSDKDKTRKKKDRSVEHGSEKKSKNSCGHCSNCLRQEDCGNCQTCKDAKRFSGVRAREKCYKRQCLKVPVHLVPVPA
ncbi:hypothetical protein J6590_049136 [Homalodisca vitripennis]|nr:hypothetical protein J6590_049136 [Homalodisca vitripennis]